MRSVQDGPDTGSPVAGESTGAPDIPALVDALVPHAGPPVVGAVGVRSAVAIGLDEATLAVFTIGAPHDRAPVQAPVLAAQLPVVGAVLLGLAVGRAVVPVALLLLLADDRGRVAGSVEVVLYA